MRIIIVIDNLGRCIKGFVSYVKSFRHALITLQNLEFDVCQPFFER